MLPKITAENISYFAIHNSSNCESNLWKNFLEPFLIYLQGKGYYVPNNCFVEESNLLGFANSFNPWVKKIRAENKTTQLNKQAKDEKKWLNRTDSGYKLNHKNKLKEKLATKKETKLII